MSDTSTTNVAMMPPSEESRGLSSESSERQQRSADSSEVRETDATSRLRRALAAATKGGGRSDELETAARELVTELRAQAHSPEHVLLRMKRILADVGLRPSYAAVDTEHGLDRDGTLYRDVIAWSIRYYYASGDGRR